MNKILIMVVIIGIGLYSYIYDIPSTSSSFSETKVNHEQITVKIDSKQNNYNQTILDAYRNQRSNIQVNGSGEVIRILNDDNEGSRHQRFILSISSGHTLLVAHNIDLAPRINNLHKGDIVDFFGQYEWNNKGGVLHWTHHDPRGHHIAGWLKHNGRKYE